VTTEISSPPIPSALIAVPRAQRAFGWKFFLAAALVISAFCLLWTFVLRDRFIVKKWGVIVPGVAFRSGQISQHLVKQTLQSHSIQHIICMTSPDLEDADQQAELQASADLNTDFVYLPLNGRGVGKVEHFTGAVTRLAKNIQLQEPVLVHCHAGAQRTGGVVAAYRLLIENRSPEFVVDELKAYGWNPRRDQILLDFLNQNLRKAAEELVAAGCLAQVPAELPLLK
jgi:protein tyrosine/serine phosphatase